MSRRKRYDHLYEQAWRTTTTHCTYCNDVAASHWDYIPTLSSRPPRVEQPLKVYACRRCVELLRNNAALSVRERAQYVAQRTGNVHAAIVGATCDLRPTCDPRPNTAKSLIFLSLFPI